MKRINIYEYIYANNPKGVSQLLNDYGVVEPKGWVKFHDNQKIDYILKAMDKLSEHIGDRFNDDLLKLHSDKDIFADYFKRHWKEKFANASGDKDKTTPATHPKEKSDKDDSIKNIMHDKTAQVMIGVGLGIATVLMLKNILKP